MKKLIALLAIAGALNHVAHAQHETSCSYTVLSGTRTTNLTLSASTKYEIRGCYKIANGAKLTIPAGTILFAQKSSSAELYIEPGAQIDAQGTSTNPIVFTSDQDPTYRAAGDWKGVILGGYATNNVSGGQIAFDRTCSITAGGEDDADNSGIMRYVQIHYAVSALTLASVGNGTTIDHIQSTFASANSFEALGGTVDMKNLASFNPSARDFSFTDGYRGNLQFPLAWRQDASKSTASISQGVFVTNDPSGSTNAPRTRPVISNMTLIGPGFCATGSLTNFDDAVQLSLNGQAAVYNTVITDWPRAAFYLNHSGSIAATANNKVQYSYNSMDNNGIDYDKYTFSWPSGCETSMQNWIEGLGSMSCDEAGNQLAGFGTVGYSSSICSSTTPDFTLGSNGLDAPDFSESDLSSAFFNSSFSTRGAFDGSDNWVANWTEFDPENVDYCPSHRMAASTKEETMSNGVSFAPNPATNTTYALFDASQGGKVTISVLDKINGQPLKSITSEVVTPGKQKMAINVSGLRSGVYIIRVEMSKQAPVYGQLSIN